HAPYAGSECITRPLVFSGSRLALNVSTSAAGSVQVELQESDGAPIPGYGLADCREIYGDEIERIVEWTHGAGLEALAGRPIRLRFALNDCDIFSFHFQGDFL
ncbi:MAG: hypothetical protein JXA42_11610, partial [Anaerolineales bacterium]|nr:hypothetical protein [Anaerolineales bacterium]